MLLFPWLLVLLLCVVRDCCSEVKACEDAQKTCSVVVCGIPVTNGTPGRDGRDGPKGEKGDPGTGWGLCLSWEIVPYEGEHETWEASAFALMVLNEASPHSIIHGEGHHFPVKVASRFCDPIPTQKSGWVEEREK